MPDITILEAVKTSLRITTTLFDNDLAELISAAEADMVTGGVTEVDESEPLVRQAIKFYCRANFQNGDAKEREHNDEMYQRVKNQLGTCQIYHRDPVDDTAQSGEGGGGA